jgi:hypothetical protein
MHTRMRGVVSDTATCEHGPGSKGHAYASAEHQFMRPGQGVSKYRPCSCRCDWCILLLQAAHRVGLAGLKSVHVMRTTYHSDPRSGIVYFAVVTRVLYL